MSDRSNVSSSLSAEVINYLRKQGRSQVEIARMLGVSEGFISLVKSKERSLTIDHLELLSDALSVPLGALLLAITEPRKRTKNNKKLFEMSARVVEKADQARSSILRSSTVTSR